MFDWLIWLVLAPVVFLVLVIGTIVVTFSIIVIKARRAPLERAPEKQYAGPIRSAQAHDAWAEAQGFTPVGQYVLKLLAPGFIAVWQQKEAPTFLCFVCNE